MAGLGSYMSRVVRAFLPGMDFALFLVLGAAAASVPAEAQPSQNWTLCVSKGKSFSPDVVIAGCTAVIQSGKETRSNLAIDYHNRGNAYYAKSESDRAVADFTKAIEIDPIFAAAYYSRATANYNNGEYDNAIADFTKAIELEPKYAVRNRGTTYTMMKNLIRSDPTFTFYAGRAAAYWAKGEHDSAIADYSKVINLEPKYPDAYTNRAKVYTAKGDLNSAGSDFSTAISLFNTAIKLKPNSAILYNNRGNVYAAKGDYDLAIADFTKAIKIDPKLAVAYTNRAWVHTKTGNSAEGLADAEKSLELAPGVAYALDTRGRIFEALGRREEAVRGARQE
jgi:tetratricopeptide (TPR) repeat protein